MASCLTMHALQGILEAELEAGPPSPDIQDQVAMAKPSVLFDIPGGSGMEIPYEEWKEASRVHHHHEQQQPVVHTPTSRSAETDGLGDEKPRHVLEAWGGDETCQQEQEADQVGRAVDGMSEHHDQEEEKEQNKRDAIKSEW